MDKHIQNNNVYTPQEIIELLDSYLPDLLEALFKKGYSKKTLKYYKRYLSDFNSWLYKQNLGIDSIDEKLIDKFYSIPHENLYSKKCLNCLLLFLRGQKELLLPHERLKQYTLTPLVKEFREYLLNERGISTPKSEGRYLKVAYDFISQCIENKNIPFALINGKIVTSFLLDYLDGINPRTAQLWASILRIFLLFLYLKGLIKNNLALAVPRVAARYYSRIPKFIPSEQIKLVLASCDRNSLSGKRDYAILLLFIRLGLRGGEVLNMSLDDIDWDAGRLVIHGKDLQLDYLPLPADVGEAIAVYLRDARPNCASRRLFIRLKKPLYGFTTSTAINWIVKSAFKLAGVKTSRNGPHILRHSLANSMLNHGASLSEIAEVLRHRSLETTRIYAKIDSTALRSLSLPWPRGIK